MAITFVDNPCTCSALLGCRTLGLAAACPGLGSLQSALSLCRVMVLACRSAAHLNTLAAVPNCHWPRDVVSHNSCSATAYPWTPC